MLRFKYDISAPEQSYYAERRFFSFLANLQPLSEDRQVLARVQQRFSLFREKYDFLLSDGGLYRFRCERVWKGVFLCEGAQETFRLYSHKALTYSVFQNDVQIAAFTKNRIVVGKGNQYDVRINRDANEIVVICMVLALNTSENSDDNATVTYDFGDVGPEAKPFDNSWEPT